jgi:hypothetical protein
VARWPAHRRVSRTTWPLGNFERVVMLTGIFQIDLPEARQEVAEAEFLFELLNLASSSASNLMTCSRSVAPAVWLASLR